MLRPFLYILILVAGTNILITLELLHYHEALLVSGLLDIVVMLLVEPPGGKLARTQLWLVALFTIYGLGLKLPLLLKERMNHYLMYFIIVVLIIAINFGSVLLLRKLTSAFSAREHSPAISSLRDSANQLSVHTATMASRCRTT